MYLRREDEEKKRERGWLLGGNCVRSKLARERDREISGAGSPESFAIKPKGAFSQGLNGISLNSERSHRRDVVNGDGGRVRVSPRDSTGFL